MTVLHFVVKALFLGAPVNTTSATDMTGSMIMATPSSLASGVDSVNVKAIIEDKNGHPLGNGTVNFSVNYKAGSSLKANRGSSWSDRDEVVIAQDKDNEGETMNLLVDDFTKTGPVSVTISATYRGDTGSLAITPADHRAGPARWPASI